EGNTRWIDVPGLLELLNRALAALGEPRRLWHVWDSERYGQDFGVAFATREERDRMFADGVPIAIDERGTLPILGVDPRVDGHPAVAVDEATVVPEELARQLIDLAGGALRVDSL